MLLKIWGLIVGRLRGCPDKPTGAPRPRPVSKPRERHVRNGTIYINPGTCRAFALMYIKGGMYSILYIESGCYRPTVPGFQFNKNGEFMFTVEELKTQFNMDNWIRQAEHLEIIEDKYNRR